MTEVLLVARTHLFTALRERITLFWFLVFPVFLLVILTLIFGRIGQQGAISFDVSLINLDQSSSVQFAAMVETLFAEVGGAPAEGEEPLFKLFLPEDGENPEAFLARERDAVRRGQRAAVIVIPSGFGQHLEHKLIPTEAAASTDRPADGALTIYYSQGSPASDMAASIVEQILAGLDREILIHAGQFREADAVPSETVWAGGERTDTRYIDFLLPGIILMAFFTNGLFGIPGTILFSREQRVLRRYWVTPLSVPRYLVGLSIGHLSLCAIQLILLFAIGRFGFNATVSFAGIVPAGYLLLAATTFMAFGFLVASLAKTANAGIAIANVLNMPMMFMSGLFFPVSGLPAFLLAIVYANPVSYLAEGLRASIGVETGTFPLSLTVAVPFAWIAASAIIATRRLRWDVER